MRQLSAIHILTGPWEASRRKASRRKASHYTADPGNVRTSLAQGAAVPWDTLPPADMAEVVAALRATADRLEAGEVAPVVPPVVVTPPAPVPTPTPTPEATP